MKIWAQPLGTDPILRHLERFPVSGERLAEAILDRGKSSEARGWLVANSIGRIVFAGSSGSIRTVSQTDAMASISAMEGAEGKRAREGHHRITAQELRELLVRVGYTQSSFAREWGVADRNVRRWCSLEGDLDVPLWVGKVLTLMATYDIAPVE